MVTIANQTKILIFIKLFYKYVFAILPFEFDEKNFIQYYLIPEKEKMCTPTNV
jgi:hypothetical protein